MFRSSPPIFYSEESPLSPYHPVISLSAYLVVIIFPSNYCCSKQKISPHPRFSSIHVNRYAFENENYICGTTSIPIGSLHKAPETPARGLRGQGLKGRFVDSTERRPSRCVRVEVHERARRLKFLRLGMPCVARIRRLKHQR